MNERETEDLVQERLRRTGYYRKDSGIVIEKQQSKTPRIQKLLITASKRGNGAGKPEFLIHSPNGPDFLIVIECKANPQKHKSQSLDKYSDYAVDGVLLYASYLSKDYDVLAIAVSGTKETNLQISHFLHLRGTPKAIDFDKAARDIVSFDDYFSAFRQCEIKVRQDYQALREYSRKLNDRLQAQKVTEADRGFLVSGILIALQNKAFQNSYRDHRNAKQLAASLLGTLRSEFESARLPQDRRAELDQAFSFIPHCPALVSNKAFFIDLIQDIDKNVNAFMRTHEYYDTIGQFYVEFLKYANNDKGLGIVLTPHHIAELFAELAEVNRDSIVFDNCCGTSGLLIAAMKEMIRDAKADETLKKRIKDRQLFGIEYQAKIYALAVSNMILHGDGKANVYKDDCFESSNKLIAKHKPTVGILNPPYKKFKEDREELEFVLNNLNTLTPGGKCVAIVPFTCATTPDGAIAEWKRVILRRHTLEAVMSMPSELFHNSKTSVVTCIMVLTAHRPHSKGKKTWFGYWRDDGFRKAKKRGRIDAAGKWSDIRSNWVSAYRNREVIPGVSLMREIGPEDEWSFEAYVETDYSLITSDSLNQAITDYAVFKLLGKV